MADNVNRPAHYGTGRFGCMDVMIETQGAEAVKHFCQCSAFKYLYRAKRKNGLEDMKKAIWYMNKYVELSEQGGIGMTGQEYQELAVRTCGIPYGQKGDMLQHAVFGLASEAGEVSGIMQKVYQGHEFDVEHFKKELGDCLWMVAEACFALDISMDEVMQSNIDKLRRRYPDGFDSGKSLHRQEGDV